MRVLPAPTGIPDVLSRLRFPQGIVLIMLLAEFPLAYSQSVEELNRISAQYAEGVHSSFVPMGFSCGHMLDGPNSIIQRIEREVVNQVGELSIEEKRRIGQSNHEILMKSNSLLPLKPEVQEIFSNLLRYSDKTEFPMRLLVLSTEEVNAFAGLDGRIYLTQGLLEAVDSYDELAFVIAHEIGHLYYRHLETKLGKMALISQFTEYTQTEVLTRMAIDLNSSFTAPFSQINEYESDRYGFHLARRAGYNPKRFTDFFRRLEQNERVSLYMKLKSTHPFARDRKDCLESYMQE